MDPHLEGFWQRSLGPAPLRPPLDGSIDADVCIVGAGYTGLWTAWALTTADPALQVAVVEAHSVGWGASGRNGGWLSGLMPGNRSVLASGHPSGRDGVIAFQRALIDSVASVEKVCASEGIDADIHHGGTLAVALGSAQSKRLHDELTIDRSWGIGPSDAWELSAAGIADRVRIAGTLGGVYSPHCARIHPAKLVRGLADTVARKGVQIFESTQAVGIEGGRVVTDRGDVRAAWVVRATEGYTAGLPGERRAVLPLNSSMIVTSPLPEDAWSRIGWSGAETLRDGANVYVYAQRTADGRIAIGGRGVPYRYGSRTDSASTARATVAALSSKLRTLLPDAGDFEIADAWSGVLGVARDWCPFVNVARSGAGGVASAGGYIGDGVSTSHLAGLTLADLILGRTTERTALPWVGHTSRPWEPEPLRWLGVRSVYGLSRAADRAEERGRRGAARAANRLAAVLSGR